LAVSGLTWSLVFGVLFVMEKFGGVGDVEALRAELQEGLVVDREVLEQRQIDVAEVRTVERVLPFRPENA